MGVLGFVWFDLVFLIPVLDVILEMALLTISATQRHTGALRYSLAISAQPGADSNHWKETILSKLTQNYNLFPHCFLKKGKGD